MLPFHYPGSKYKLIRKLLPKLPQHAHHVVVFGGTGAELLAKPRSEVETFNDLSHDVTNCFRVLGDDALRRQLLNRIEYTLYSRWEYEAAWDTLHSDNDNPLTRAHAFLVVANQSRAQSDPWMVAKSSWRYCVTTDETGRWTRLPDGLEEVAKRFENVQIENKPFEYILSHYDNSKTLFTIDPPYPADTRVDKKLYQHEMTDEDHGRLLDMVRRLEGRAVVFGYPHGMYEDMLSGCERIEFKRPCAASAQLLHPMRTDVIWIK